MNEKQFLRAVQKDIRKKVRKSLTNFIDSVVDENGILDFSKANTTLPKSIYEPINDNTTMPTINISDSELKVLIAALDARDRYLAGIARRQLDYKPTPTRNRKLEAIEAERLKVEGLKFKALGETHIRERNRSIEQQAAAPAQNNNKL